MTSAVVPLPVARHGTGANQFSLRIGAAPVVLDGSARLPEPAGSPVVVRGAGTGESRLRGSRLLGVLTGAVALRARSVVFHRPRTPGHARMVELTYVESDRGSRLRLSTDREPIAVHLDERTDVVAIQVPIGQVGVHAATLDRLAGEVLVEPLIARSLMDVLRGSLLSDVDGPSSTWDPLSGLSVDRYLVTVVGMVLEAATVSHQVRPADASVRARAEALIADRFADPALAPPRIASALGVSLRSLHRAYADGAGVAHELRRVRLAHAARLLADTTSSRESVATIAERSGFASVATFNRSFIAEYAMSPHRFRRDGAGHGR